MTEFNFKSLYAIGIFLMMSIMCLHAQSRRPNIVYILADDMGIGDISATNKNTKVQTPHIDALISNGMRFTDAHTSSSVCTPSRYSILTGTYSWRTKLKERVLNGYSKAMIEDDTHTVAELLKENGYETAMFGKWHLGWDWVMKRDDLLMDDRVPYNYKNRNINEIVDYSQPFKGGPIDHGFDYFYGINASLDFPPYAFAEYDQLIAVPNKIMKPDGKRADFPKGKKNDLEGGQRLKRKGDKTIDFKAEDVMLELTDRVSDYIADYNDTKPFFLYVALTAPHTPVYPRAEFKNTSQAGIYGDFIQELDWSVGQIMKAIQSKNLEDDTIVIFTADNGASKTSFPIEFEDVYNHKPSAHLKGRKASLHQGGHTVPFVVQWNNIVPPGSTCSTPIMLNDLYATCADLLKVEINQNQAVDSYSILDLLEEKEHYDREVSVYTDFAGRFSIRKYNWKLDLNPRNKKSALYNLKDDPSEENNLFDQEAFEDKKKDLIATINNVILNGRSSAGEPLKNDGAKIWRQLFWLKTKKKNTN